MKRISTLSAAVVCLLTGFVYLLDLTHSTDLATGFCVRGSYWLRYGVLLAVTAFLGLAALVTPKRPAALLRKNALLTVGSALGALGLGVYVGIGISQLPGSGLGLAALVQLLLYLVSAVWLLAAALGFSGGQGSGPTRSAVWGVAGSLSFFYLLILRFVTHPTGIVRVGATLEVFSALALLLYVSSLSWSAYLPRADGGRRLAASGLLAFLYTGCLELPWRFVCWQAGRATLLALCESAALALLALGGLLAALALCGPEQEPEDA